MTGAIGSAGYPRGSLRTDNRRLGDQNRRNPNKKRPVHDEPLWRSSGLFGRSRCICSNPRHKWVRVPGRSGLPLNDGLAIPPSAAPVGVVYRFEQMDKHQPTTRRTKRSVQLSLPNALYIGPVTMPAKQRSACNFLKNVVTCTFFLDIAIFFVHATFLLTCLDILIHARRRVAACFVFACGTHQRTGNICSAMHTACRSRSELVVSMATLVTPGCSSAKRSASSARLRRRP